MSNKHVALRWIAVLAAGLVGCGGSSSTSESAAQGVDLMLTPSTVRIGPAESVALTATVTGTADTAVSWRVQEGDGGGRVTEGGLYTAPMANGTYHVEAVSRADAARSATATIIVMGSPPPADGAPMTAANRVTGVAPLAVFFDAVDTVPAGSASPFSWNSGVYQPPDGDYEGPTYAWHFGDGGAGVWSTTGTSRNRATGYTAAHVYETPGVYTVSLSVTDKAGAVYTYKQTITVTEFSGTTYYVAANGSDTNPGTEAQPFLTYGKGFAMANSTAGGVRVLFRRGDAFPTAGTSATGGLKQAGPGIIGAYGSGARPIINSTGTSAGIRLETSDWRIMDLDWVGTGGAGSAIDVAVGTHTERNTILRVKSSGFSVGFGMGDYGEVFANPHDGYAWVECESTARLNGMYLGGRRIAIMGSNVHDITESHVLRLWQGHKAVVSSNRLWSPGPTRHALKLPGPAYNDGRPETRWVTISDNTFQGKTWSVAIGPQDAGKDERVSHVVFERNRTYGEGSIQVDLMIWARQVMVRNNIFDGTGASAYYTGIVVGQRGIEPASADVRILNNTIVRNDAGSFIALSLASAAQSITFRNNLASAPLASAPVLVSGASISGFVEDHNLLTAGPGFTNAEAGDYTLQLTSPAVDAGAAPWEVSTDYLGAVRTNAYDLGALEVR